MTKNPNVQLFLNLSTNALSFVLGLVVSFFLTPFIIGKLGTAAYGYIGLSNNIIGYSSLLTIALNSMSSRFITLSYHKGNYSKANEYVASTFFANMAVAIVIGAALSIVTIFIDDFINIPTDLVSDVRLLFIFLSINTLIGLITGVFGVSTFVKNKIEKSNICNMIGTILRCSLILLLFALFKPRLWYFGITAIIMTLYVFFVNHRFFKTLTPELVVKFKYFNFKHVFELVKSGAWNLISSLSNLLNEGFDLLLANIFISPTAMGLLSVSKTIPTYIQSFIISLSSSFHPGYMKLYAEQDYASLKQELLKSIRILGFLSSIAISLILAYGDFFYKIWLPTENSAILYLLSCIGAILLIFALPYQSIWFVFVIDNKLKRTSINALLNSSLTFIIVLCSMFIFDDNMIRLFILAGTRTVMSSIRCLSFLPLYASKVMNFPRITFYLPMIKNVIMVVVLTAISLILRLFITAESWWSLIILCIITGIIGLSIGLLIVLNKSDRMYIVEKLVAIKNRLIVN